ncbi:MAG: CPBP family intramembrane metalloprotease, partial [Cyanothece sp. SIO2G6]|nr:CPBP family intramembrane metalloprotease [Cyanothece sp. SIO2G6]
MGPSFLHGLILSIASFGILFGFYLWTGWAGLKLNNPPKNSDDTLGSHQDEPDFWPLIVSKFGLFLALSLMGGIVGFIEELVFRGFFTGRLTLCLDVWQAGLLASLIFALLHLVWDGKSAVPQLPGLWLMGGVLTVAWCVDQQ